MYPPTSSVACEPMTELETIPGVGPAISKDLRALGYRCVEDLRNENPETMYEQSNQLAGLRQDPCLLYVFRCAVYFAETRDPDPELLRWWSWKDRRLER